MKLFLLSLAILVFSPVSALADTSKTDVKSFRAEGDISDGDKPSELSAASVCTECDKNSTSVDRHSKTKKDGRTAQVQEANKGSGESQ
ncbi:MAG: hypothetical protein KDD38_06045 [Bdellovibrionales bacterium]|nr:hypothetical protein [Bdellovibrionales bacterium]